MVRPGYKETEIGIIPEDWTVESLGEKFHFIGGGTPSKDNVEYWNGDIPWVSSSDLREGDIRKIHIDRYITKNALRKSATQLCPAGAVLVVSRVGVGKIAVAEKELCTSQDFTNIVCTDYNNYFLAYSLLPVMKELARDAQGTSIKGVTTSDIKNLKIGFPLCAEQDGIVETLLDVDKLIDSLEKLIAKKKAIKQGAMQELLTGKKRLPGFKQEWLDTCIGNICELVSGGTPSTSVAEYWDGNIPWCTPTDITNCVGKYLTVTANKITLSGLQCSSATMLPKGSLLLCTRATIGELKIATMPICTNQGFKSLVAYENTDNEWLYYAIQMLKQEMISQAIGSTFLEISKKALANIRIKLPSKNEQQAIASILSDMDDEIIELEQKLAKYRQVKQGMMQQLLTGKIRLIDTIDAVQQAEQTASIKDKPAKSAHNHQFDDAVSIAAIVDTFYSDKYPLGRVKVQKLLYLLHRHQAVSVSDFKKKAAGPYADAVRYKGGEPIAKKNKYIAIESGKQGTRYFKGENIAQALKYVERWGMQADVDWLKENFLHTSRNELELFATVDMAMCDLNEAGIPVSVASIKNLIASNKEWKAKLAKAYFSDSDINRAIKKCAALFYEK